jgi:acetyl-CoA acetyltransferase family protein
MSARPEAVIVGASRTAIGTANKGTLAATTAFELAEFAIAGAIERTGLEAEVYDDLVLGEVMQGGGNIARHSAVKLGLIGIPGLALNRQCASALAALQVAAADIRSGMGRAILAGGAESLSTTPQVHPRILGTRNYDMQPWMSPSHPPTEDAPAVDMSITVGWNTAKIAGISREDMDAWAYGSHVKAVRAIDEGRFVDEIIPIKVTRLDGETVVFDTDEHPRRDASLEKMSSLRVLHPEIEGFSITAANSSGLNDGAAVVSLVADDLAAEHGLEPLAVVRSWANVGVDPIETGLGPSKAIPLALKRAGLSVGDVNLFEINEAFASMCVATVRNLDLDPDLVNVSGSGVSLGHPIAASGARMVTTIIHELRRRGQQYGVISLCAGGGMGAAMVIEALPA